MECKCPACGGKLINIRAKLVCEECHTIVESCCEGGRTGFVAILLLCLMLCGCEEPYKAPIGPDVPTAPSVQPHKIHKLVLVTTDRCVWCDRQKAVIAQLIDEGTLDADRVLEVNHSHDIPGRTEYPTVGYPTMYIYPTEWRTPTKLYGYKDTRELRHALQVCESSIGSDSP